jgi:hypothetical protein
MTATARPAPAHPASVRDVRHLGDFSVTPRMIVIAALALPVGAGGALAAWVLTRLIGLITNAVFHHRVSVALTSPGEHAAWWVVLLAPILGGLVVGVMARYGPRRSADTACPRRSRRSCWAAARCNRGSRC